MRIVLSSVLQPANRVVESRVQILNRSLKMTNRDLVLKIHGTPHKAVIALTGGGAEVIGELLRYGQGSSTLLEAIVPYDQKSFDNFVKGTPDKYCSPGAARDLAMAAYQKAIKYSGVEQAETLIGIGASCSLAKDNEREGREHHAYIAVQTSQKTTSYEIDLTNYGYNRVEEETLVANAILGILGYTCDLDGAHPLLRHHLKEFDGRPLPQIVGVVRKGTPEMFKLLTGQAECLTFPKCLAWNIDGCLPTINNENRVIFAGSFNPLHPRHAEIAAKVSEITGKPVDLEVCVHNVDKPAFNYFNLQERIENLKENREKAWCGDLHFTSLATFMQKAEYFWNATFVVGWDTFKRISDPKYGKIDEVVATLIRQKSKFIVFHRIMDGKSSHEEGIEGIDPRFLGISEIISPEVLPPSDMSSSKIRLASIT